LPLFNPAIYHRRKKLLIIFTLYLIYKERWGIAEILKKKQ